MTITKYLIQVFEKKKMNVLFDEENLFKEKITKDINILLIIYIIIFLIKRMRIYASCINQT